LKMIGNRFFGVAMVPLILAAGAGFGGATPGGDGEGGLALRLSRTTIQFGSTTVASGASIDVQPGSTVVVSLEETNGTVTKLSTGSVDSRGRWSIAVRPAHSGLLRASAASLGTGVVIASSGHRVKVLPAVRIKAIPRVAPGQLAAISGEVKPAGNQSVKLYIGSPRGRRLVASTRARRGHFSARVRASGGVSVLYAAIGPGPGNEGGLVTAGRVMGLRPAGASWYGLYGEGLACGGRLGVNQIGVAHKTLPCGTKVTIYYRGRTIVAPVIDRGPFIAGREFDLTGAAARALRFDGVDTIWVAP